MGPRWLLGAGRKFKRWPPDRQFGGRDLYAIVERGLGWSLSFVAQAVEVPYEYRGHRFGRRPLRSYHGVYRKTV